MLLTLQGSLIVYNENKFLWAELCLPPPQIHTLKSQLLVFNNMTVFWDRDFKKII